MAHEAGAEERVDDLLHEELVSWVPEDVTVAERREDFYVEPCKDSEDRSSLAQGMRTWRTLMMGWKTQPPRAAIKEQLERTLRKAQARVVCIEGPYDWVPGETYCLLWCSKEP